MPRDEQRLVLNALAANYAAYFRLGQGLSGYTYQQMKAGTLYVNSGWHDPFFNVVLSSDVNSSALKLEAEAVLALFLAEDRPFRWKVYPAQLELRTFLKHHGLTVVEKAFAFASTGVVYPSFNEHSTRGEKYLQLLDVSDSASRSLWWKVFSSAFDVRTELREAICEFNDRATKTLARSLFRNFVFLSGRNPVCSATVFRHAGTYSLYDLGVAPEHRGRGYAQIAIRQLQYLIQKESPSTLTFYSTMQARSLYRSIGYSEHQELEFYGRS